MPGAVSVFGKCVNNLTLKTLPRGGRKVPTADAPRALAGFRLPTPLSIWLQHAERDLGDDHQTRPPIAWAALHPVAAAEQKAKQPGDQQ